MTDPFVLLPMLAAGLATALGAVPIIVVRRLSHRVHDTFLGFAAGIMLGVAALDLLPHALDLSGPDLGGAIVAALVGGGAILALTTTVRRMPLPMPFIGNGRPTSGTAFLIFLALAIHNAPEGLATGLGYAGGLTAEGHAIALAIAMQNIPEGLLVALPILAETGSRRGAFGYAVLSGLVEPAAGAAALLLVSLSPALLGAAFAFAAGAMLTVVLVQMVPESHRHGHHVPASFTLQAGFLLVLLMQVSIAGLLG